ncbi:CD63 antigen [Schistosoma japonicum]|nr:CD63 antigen [Schistosoma japonicum]
MVALTCGQRCLQIILVIFNTVVLLCGTTLLVVGLVACVSLSKYSKTDVTVRGFAVSLVILGVITFFLGMIGCCAACKESLCKLILYAMLLLIVILCEVAAGIGALVMKDEVREKFTIGVKDAVKNYYNNPDLKSVIDKIQDELECCGAESEKEYNKEIPLSCFKDNIIHKMGCVEAIDVYVKKYMAIIVICTFVFALLQILSFVFTICLCNAIRRSKAEQY